MLGPSIRKMKPKRIYGRFNIVRLADDRVAEVIAARGNTGELTTKKGGRPRCRGGKNPRVTHVAQRMGQMVLHHVWNGNQDKAPRTAPEREDKERTYTKLTLR